MLLCEKHGRSIYRCGRCLPKKFWPKGLKACRCGVLIDKTWAKCGPCLEWETQDWVEDGLEDRVLRHGLLVQINS